MPRNDLIPVTVQPTNNSSRYNVNVLFIPEVGEPICIDDEWYLVKDRKQYVYTDTFKGSHVWLRIDKI